MKKTFCDSCQSPNPIVVPEAALNIKLNLEVRMTGEGAAATDRSRGFHAEFDVCGCCTEKRSLSAVQIAEVARNAVDNFLKEKENGQGQTQETESEEGTTSR